MKYLATRYEKGVARVEAYMADHQRYSHVPNLSDALPDVMRALTGISRDEMRLGQTWTGDDWR